MKRISALFFISVIFLLFSCVSNETANSDTVKQSEIYQSYTITYDEGDMELSATAFFRFGGATGTSLHLVKPSSILFNSKEMDEGKNIFSGTFYEINLQTDPAKSYTFIFTDTDNKTYSNSASIDKLAFDEFPKIFKRKETCKVSWTGEPVKEGERVYVTLESKDNITLSASAEKAGATYVEFSPAILKDIKPCDANMVLRREKTSNLKEATHLGGSLTIMYVAKKVTVKVE